ncbi:MAG: hypothetical protein K5841_01565 [Fretibacterium sp.]|nr:hypothetical protein [Fretibacterium sp.]
MIPAGIRPTKWETLCYLWEIFTGVRDGKAVRFWRFICWVLLGTGITFAAASYSHLLKLQETKNFISSLPSLAWDTDKARLQSLSDGLHLALQQRARSTLLVQAMRERGRSNLFAVQTFSKPSAVPDLNDQDISISPPPEIVVRAVMKAGKSWTAIVDIAGADSGLILHPGDSFMDGRGKAVRMDGDKLIVLWDGREWTAVPGLF